jgi:hypothetical protein
MDEIDYSCMTHSKCWGCAQALYGKKCSGHTTSYRWKFIKDKGTKIPIDISCLDDDPCQRAICECDRSFAFNLRDMESVYKKQYRTTDKAEMCSKRGLAPSAALTTRGEIRAPLDSCCGDDIFKFPYASNSGLRNCCGTRTYDTQTLECCDQSESKIRAIGACSSP